MICFKLTEFLLINFCLVLLEFYLIPAAKADLSLYSPSSQEHANFDDNEFAEFEEFDEDDEYVRPIQSTPAPSERMHQSANQGSESTSSASSFAKNNIDNDAIIEDEDDEEFETIREEVDDDKSSNIEQKIKDGIEITKIPLHLRSNWKRKSSNSRIATNWFESHKEILDSNFALVGDDGKREIQNPGLLKETENIYTLWCSGRVSIDGMLTEIQLIKRQDLFSSIINFFKPTSDKILIKAFLSSDAMDNFVFCIAQRKIALKLSKEINDLAIYCPERKNPEKYGLTSENYLLINEIGEAASFILDGKICSLLDKNDDIIEYIHISDQFSGFRNDDTQQTIKLPEVKKVLIISLYLPTLMSSQDVEDLDRLKTLLQMVFYLVDKLKRFRLSKEKKLKSDRNRQKIAKLFLQSTHQQRQEAAQMKREEKRRAEKEKILNEMDPEKQRKWEEKEYKRELKKKIPKMKQLKVKAM